ncbi:adenylosuccinate synthetase [Patescibacteria group bacterium]|nr:MAG: adenylosuccinate synthetase [Patescibacteria group bacterium]
MPTTVILGAQWGDEGKGKIVDRKSSKLRRGSLCVRHSGGANAGHTTRVGDEKFVTHVLPSGIMNGGVLNLIGPAVACDLAVMREELTIAKRFGSEVAIDRSAPVVLPPHFLLDGLREDRAGEKKIGTTRRGIGPVFSAFFARNAVRMGDLTNADKVRASLLERHYYDEMAALIRLHEGTPPTCDEIVEWCMQFAPTMRPLLADTRQIVWEAHRENRDILFEGAQGVLLDIYNGSQPDTTSSLCTLAGVSATFGVYRFDHVIGVAKAYATRVGSGPFPTELMDETGERIRVLGNEFGATTGRPRRCGWLDLPALIYACRMGGITELAMTKGDALEGFDEVRVATRYVFEGRPISLDTLTSRVLREAQVHYSAHTKKQDSSQVRCKEMLLC